MKNRIELSGAEGKYHIYLNGKLKIADIRVRDFLEGDRCTEKNTGIYLTLLPRLSLKN